MAESHLTIFKKLQKKREKGIQELIDNAIEESLHLEFKTSEASWKNDKKFPTDEDKNKLAKALSAFSNSAGGLFIWGIQEKQHDNGIIAAHGKAPINQIGQAYQKIKQIIESAITPHSDVCQVLKIECDDDKNKGYLAILIERSESRPHRAEHGHKQYFKRNGASSIVMEHYEIEDSFKRPTYAYPELEYKLSNDLDYYNSSIQLAVHLNLKNNALHTSGRYPYLSLKNSGAYHIKPLLNETIRQFENDGFRHLNCSEKIILHPNQSFYLCDIITRVSVMGSQNNFVISRNNIKEISFSYICGFENSRAVHGQITIGLNKLLHHLEQLKADHKNFIIGD